MGKLKLKIDKHTILKNAWHVFLVVAGTLVLAFGSGCFLVPFNIISGGVTGFSLLLKDFIPVDITAAILTWALFFLGLLFLGFKFSVTTLISTILYPIVLSLVLRLGLAEEISGLIINHEIVQWSATHVGEAWLSADGIIVESLLETVNTGKVLICGLLGGACVGVGCSLTFIGGGSTGGLDILSFIINKFTGIKQSVLFFVTDSLIVCTGLIVDLVKHNSTFFVAGLIGIIAAFICSFMVEVVYVSKEGAFNVDVITDKPEEIIEYARSEVNRSATVFKVQGAYSQEEKTMVRITFNRREYMKIKDGIAKIDPQSFATFSQTMLVGGLGFTKMKTSDSNIIKDAKKAIEQKKLEAEASKNEENSKEDNDR